MPRFQVGDRVHVIETTQRAPGALRGQTGRVAEVKEEDLDAGPEEVLYTVRFEGSEQEIPVYESALEAGAGPPGATTARKPPLAPTLRSHKADPGDPSRVLCNHLRSFGVKAEPWHVVQDDEWPGTKWRIDLSEGPIRHVLIWNFEYYSEAGPDRADRGFSYLVEDPRILANLAERETGQVAFFEIPGDFWQDTGGPDIVEAVRRHAPSRLQWEDYESLARRQLATAFPGTRQWTEAECAALSRLGIDARVLELDPFTSTASEIWIEIAEGPIRWFASVDPETSAVPEDFESLCYVPDSRIRTDSARLSFDPHPVKSFPLFGRVKGVRWTPHSTGDDSTRDFSLQVAGSLTENSAVTQSVLESRPASLQLRTDPPRGCWTIVQDGRESEWTPELWALYQEIAKHLLALPMPTMGTRDS